VSADVPRVGDLVRVTPPEHTHEVAQLMGVVTIAEVSTDGTAMVAVRGTGSAYRGINVTCPASWCAVVRRARNANSSDSA
jgi:hypothetical protein